MPCCAICVPKRSFVSVKLLLAHIKQHHNAPLKAYKCGERDCTRKFSSSKAFTRHLKNHEAEVVQNVNQCELASRPMIHFEDTVSLENIEVDSPQVQHSEADFQKSLKQTSDAFVCKYYSHPSLPRSVVQNVVDDMSDFLCNGFAMLSLKENVISALRLVQCDNSKVEDISRMFESVQNSFAHLETEFKRTNYFEKLGSYIRPHSFGLGKKLVALKTKGSVKYVWRSAKAVHVPLLPVLKKFLELPDCLHSILEYRDVLESNKDNISNFIQCDLWKKKLSRFRNSDIVLPLFVYFDDFESNNPLGPHSSKIGGIYATIGCLPPEIASRLENIFLCTLFYSEDRPLFNAKKILQPLLKELKRLEEEGIEIELPSKEVKHVYLVLGLLLGDNLGVQQLCGFVCGFGWCNYPCRFSKIFKLRLKFDIEPDLSILRNKENYAEDLELQDQTRTGIKEECPLNSLESFHITENFEGDILHDFDEGICHYVMTFVISSLTKAPARNVPPVFSLATLNRRLVLFNFGTHSALYNTKLCITEDHLKNQKLKMTGSEMQCFTQNFGVLVGDLVPEDNLAWKLYLSLLNVLDIVLAKNIPRSRTAILQENLRLFGKEFLSHDGNHLVFKFHKVLWHYVLIILMSGPIANISVRRFESKHRQLKLSLYSNMSRVMAILSVAIKHQLSLSHRFIAQISVLPDIDVGPGQIYKPLVYKLPQDCCDDLLKFFGNVEEIFMSFWVNYKGSRYDQHTVIICDIDDNFGVPIFAHIVLIFSHGKKVAFLCNRYETIEMDEHKHAFKVLHTKQKIIVSVDSLVELHPLNALKNSKSTYVVLKYQI